MARPCFVLVLHLSVLMFYIYSIKNSVDIRKNFDSEKMVFHLRKLEKFRNITREQVEEYFKSGKYVGLLFFTLWTFALQIIFLILAVTDEITKITKFQTVQRWIEKIRIFFFSTLVLPCSLLVTSVFWVIWHIDRELIFPRALDDFYPSWLNHTLHTFIVIPLIVEVLVQLQNRSYRISRSYSAIILMTYCGVYQCLYLSIYFKHGIWLYPVYKVLTWTQRVAFMTFQLMLVLLYQQIGISLLKREKSQKTKTI